jgi:hypothetical protein
MKPLFTILAIASLTTLAAADPKDCEKDQPHTVKIEKKDGKAVMVITGDIIVCQKLPKPSVAYITAPKNINYVWEDLRKQFLPLIMATVKKAPL